MGGGAPKGPEDQSLRKCVLLGRALVEDTHSLGPAPGPCTGSLSKLISSLGLYFLCKMELIIPAPPCLWDVAGTKPV